MRGDSIRDLYAKTLALLGLGVLAGTGALVDYWPSGVRLPVVEAGFFQADFSLALSVPDRPFEFDTVDRPSQARPAAVRRLVPPPPVQLAAYYPIDAQHVLEPAPQDEDIAVPAGPAVDRAPAVTLAQADMREPLGRELTLSEPIPAAWTESALARSTAPVTLDNADDRGVISGMVRATKSSLMTTGRKTGASIMGAFRAVGGAVRKALPN